MVLSESEYTQWFSDMNPLQTPAVSGVKDGELMRILQEGLISSLFQPIVSLRHGSILGYEALSRGPEGSPLHRPDLLFDMAKIYNKLWETESLCRIKALEAFSLTRSDAYLFINVDPAVIHDEKFRSGFTRDFLDHYGIDPSRIVFEITERTMIHDPQAFRRTIEHYKDQGYKIAIDDTGSGYSGLKLIADIHPHFIKLDMNLIRDIDKDSLKYALIRTFHDFCDSTDIRLIAEGIETVNELNTLIDLGIHFGQGYLLSRPSAGLSHPAPDTEQHILTRNARKARLHHARPTCVTMDAICRDSEVLPPACTGNGALEFFNQHSTLASVPVVAEGRLHGLLTRHQFFSKLGTQYGYALFQNRPVTLVMDPHPLIVAADATLDQVARQAMGRPEANLYDDILVVREDQYLGVVTVKDLLMRSTELEISYAKHLNPLTGLPGNILIERRLEAAISSCSDYAVLYLDIDNFKAYNDTYGFENGDRVLQHVGRILQDVIPRSFSQEIFCGHVGGDDFVLIFEGHDYLPVCTLLIELFDGCVPEYYSPLHRQQGFICAHNRHGAEEQYPLMTLSIAVVTGEEGQFQSACQLGETAGQVKKQCKLGAGSSRYICR